MSTGTATYFKPTVRFVVECVAVITAYDVWAVSHDYQDTISYVLGSAAQHWPIIGVMVGILVGHLFFPNHVGGET